MYCKYCGKEIKNDINFCSNCGKNLSGEIKKEKDPSIVLAFGILSICFSFLLFGIIFSIIGLKKYKFDKKNYILLIIGGSLSIIFYILYTILIFRGYIF